MARPERRSARPGPRGRGGGAGRGASSLILVAFVVVLRQRAPAVGEPLGGAVLPAALLAVVLGGGADVLARGIVILPLRLPAAVVARDRRSGNECRQIGAARAPDLVEVVIVGRRRQGRPDDRGQIVGFIVIAVDHGRDRLLGAGVEAEPLR